MKGIRCELQEMGVSESVSPFITNKRALAGKWSKYIHVHVVRTIKLQDLISAYVVLQSDVGV